MRLWLQDHATDRRLNRVRPGHKAAAKPAVPANFLLAWWNALHCGGFDLTDLSAVDKTVADHAGDRCLHRPPSEIPEQIRFGLGPDFQALVALWRPLSLEPRR
jgi:hypothetical protein